MDSGAADRAWDDEEVDSGILSKSPEVPDDWEVCLLLIQLLSEVYMPVLGLQSLAAALCPPFTAPAEATCSAEPQQTAEPLEVAVSPPSAKAQTVPEPIAAEGPADAVLVFLPGLKEIQALQEAMMSLPEFAREPQRSWILPLHSTVPPEEQRLVFQRPPPGIHKVEHALRTRVLAALVTMLHCFKSSTGPDKPENMSHCGDFADRAGNQYCRDRHHH